MNYSVFQKWQSPAVVVAAEVMDIHVAERLQELGHPAPVDPRRAAVASRVRIYHLFVVYHHYFVIIVLYSCNSHTNPNLYYA